MHGFWTNRKSPFLGVWVARDGRKTHSKRSGATRPTGRKEFGGRWGCSDPKNVLPQSRRCPVGPKAMVLKTILCLDLLALEGVS